MTDDPAADVRTTDEREGLEHRAWIRGDEVEVALALAEVATWIDEAVAVTVLTGAGISTDSGIADFRGRNGVWTRNPAAEKASTIEHYLSSTEVRAVAWARRGDSSAWRARPNVGHEALVGLQGRGKLDTLVTQNTDGLHLVAGIDAGRLVEVHGTMRTVGCTTCPYSAPTEEVLARVAAGEADPPCPICGGILKTDTILFGEALRPGDLDAADAAARRCDLLLAVGSTLAVYPVAAMVGIAARSGATVVIVNGGPTEADGLADAVIRGSISEILPAIVAAPPR